MRSEYQAHQDMRVSERALHQEDIRTKNLEYIKARQDKSAANIERFDGIVRAAFFIALGLIIALVLKEFGVWL